MRDVAILGVGYAGFAQSTPGVSYKELMFEAAQQAYADADLDPRRDIQSFVCCTEDFWEGTSISDEYMPDQLGAALRPLCTISGDGLLGLSTAYMQIKTGLFDLVAVEAHSKLSDVLSKDQIIALAHDPSFLRPITSALYAVAGLEMRRFLYESQNRREDCARVVVQNRRNALLNPRASYGAKLTSADILRSETVADPLTALEVSPPADAAIVLVLGSRRIAAKTVKSPLWIEGISWYSGFPWIGDRDFSAALYATSAAKGAYPMAGIRQPRRQLDFAEVDDTFAFKELQHLEAIGLAKPGESGRRLTGGAFDLEGEMPVNPSGGTLGVGYMAEASGLSRILHAVLQLRGEAGKFQVKGARRGVIQSWRGVPTDSGAVVVLSA